MIKAQRLSSVKESANDDEVDNDENVRPSHDEQRQESAAIQVTGGSRRPPDETEDAVFHSCVQ